MIPHELYTQIVFGCGLFFLLGLALLAGVCLPEKSQ